MGTIVPTRAKPEDEELAKKRGELAQLESELTDRELYIATLRTELSSFEQQYLKIVGTRYAELDEINAQVAEQLARERSDNPQLKDAAQKAHRQAAESRSTANASKDHARVMPSQKLKSLYRETAKRVHPDLSVDAADQKIRQRLMAEAIQAYEKGDEAHLKQILEEYESSPETVQGDGVGAELVRVIRKITQVRRRLQEINEESQRLLGSDLAKLKEKAEQYARQGRDLLQEMAQQVERTIAAARERLASIQHGAGPYANGSFTVDVSPPVSRDIDSSANAPETVADTQRQSNGTREMWNTNDHDLWQNALNRYWTFVKPSNLALEKEMDQLDAETVKMMDPQAWFVFLLEKYFRWKYTAPNRYGSTTKILRTYAANNELAALHAIKERLFASDKGKIQQCLALASSIRGLGTAGASGLLAVLFPRLFGTVDQFAVKALAKIPELPERDLIVAMNPESLKLYEGAILIRIMRHKAAELNRAFSTTEWTPRKVDMVLWTCAR